MTETSMITPAQLMNSLMGGEDSDTAITIYKEAASYAGKYKEVQDAAKALAKQDMKSNGEASFSGTYGKAGWTKPKKKKLDKVAWLYAVASDPALGFLLDDLAKAQAAVEKAQEPCMVLPEGNFYIR